MKHEDAGKASIGNVVIEMSAKGMDMTASQIAEIVQSFLRDLEDKVSWPASAAVRTVHGIITKARKKYGF